MVWEANVDKRSSGQSEIRCHALPFLGKRLKALARAAEAIRRHHQGLRLSRARLLTLAQEPTTSSASATAAAADRAPPSLPSSSSASSLGKGYRRKVNDAQQRQQRQQRRRRRQRRSSGLSARLVNAAAVTKLRWTRLAFPIQGGGSEFGGALPLPRTPLERDWRGEGGDDAVDGHVDAYNGGSANDGCRRNNNWYRRSILHANNNNRNGATAAAMSTTTTTTRRRRGRRQQQRE